MTGAFLILSLVTVAGAIGAMALRNLVHCVLCLVVTFAGLAAVFLQLHAEFVGFVQILVYVGAVAILMVFAILLTRGTEDAADPAAPAEGGAPALGRASRAAGWGLWVAGVVFVMMAGAILSSSITRVVPPAKQIPTVRHIGDQLMQDYVLPLEVLGLLLTAALVGAVVIAMHERKKG